MARNEDHGEGAGAAEGPVKRIYGKVLYGSDVPAGFVRIDNGYDAERAEFWIDMVPTPHTGELEIDLFNALVEVGNFPDDVKVADIDHQAVAQRLVELGWTRP